MGEYCFNIKYSTMLGNRLAAIYKENRTVVGEGWLVIGFI